MVYYLLKGIFLGIGLVIPLGPQNAFIFNQATMTRRFASLFPILAIAILSDILLILAAVLGVDIFSYFPTLKFLLPLFGSSFLFFMAWKSWQASSAAHLDSNPIQFSISRQVVYTLSVSLINPHAILDTFVVIGSVTSNYAPIEKRWVASGCIMADSMWFIALAFFGFYTTKINNSATVIKVVNRVSSLVMIYFAIDLTCYFIQHFRTI